jgi:hypothetical protein
MLRVPHTRQTCYFRHATKPRIIVSPLLFFPYSTFSTLFRTTSLGMIHPGIYPESNAADSIEEAGYRFRRPYDTTFHPSMMICMFVIQTHECKHEIIMTFTSMGCESKCANFSASGLKNKYGMAANL